MYETRRSHPLPPRHFARRIAIHFFVALVVVLASLAGGMVGYHHFEHLPWLDAFLNTAMLLGGMGPVDPPRTQPGKLFAGCFALYAGLVFLVVAALLLAPVLHRMLHKFHWNESEK